MTRMDRGVEPPRADGALASAILQDEHRHIDRRLQEYRRRLAAGEAGGAPLEEATVALRRHIYLEEEYLFPPLVAAGLAAPVTARLEEHGELWQMLDPLDEMIVAPTHLDDARAALDRLRMLLETHGAEEERVLYPAVDEMLFAAGSRSLRRHLAMARPFRGWRCDAVRRAR